MTSLKQIEANRRNASKSTGPSTEAGKQRSRRNAVRHGLTAETVIGALEDTEDYRRFEEAITADFNPKTAVERELVLRLASLLWRLRRAASIETGMFQNSARGIPHSGQSSESGPGGPAGVVHIGSIEPFENEAQLARDDPNRTEAFFGSDADAVSDLADRFLQLAADDKGAFERLGRYETALWRQVWQTVFMLEFLRRQGLDSKWLPRSRHQGGNSFSLSVFSRR